MAQPCKRKRRSPTSTMIRLKSPKATIESASKIISHKTKKQNAAVDADAKPVFGELLKIGDVAKNLGVSASLVRAWERRGLAHPARTESRYRVYSSEDLSVLRRAVYLRRVEGLNATAILRLLKQDGLLREGEPEQSPIPVSWDRTSPIEARTR